MLKKILKCTGYVLLALAMGAALAYVVMNVHGKRAWERHKRECEANGINLDWLSCIPPPIPDDENIAMAPIFQDLLAKPPRREIRLSYAHYPSDPNAIQGTAIWRTGEYQGLGPWRVVLSNDNLLAALSVYDDDLREVKEALKRPAFRYEAWDRASVTITNRAAHSSLPVMGGNEKALLNICRLRALARYETGQYDGMLEDVQTGFRMANLIQAGPMFLAVLNHVGVSGSCVPLWLGLRDRVWDAQQLASLQDMLGEANLVEHVAQAIRFERSQGAYLLLLPRSSTYHKVASYIRKPVWHMIPKGYFYQNAVRTAKQYNQRECMVHADGRWFDIPQMKRMERARPNVRFIFAENIWQNSSQAIIIKYAAQAQATLHQAMIACAIERYRLEHGRIPERLDELVPQYLARIPCDPCDGQPMRYRLDGDSDYTLYSIGWNCVDDGGELGLNPKYKNARIADIDRGDWIWRSAPERN